jgi:hypothetical protein
MLPIELAACCNRSARFTAAIPPIAGSVSLQAGVRPLAGDAMRRQDSNVVAHSEQVSVLIADTAYCRHLHGAIP